MCQPPHSLWQSACLRLAQHGSWAAVPNNIGLKQQRHLTVSCSEILRFMISRKPLPVACLIPIWGALGNDPWAPWWGSWVTAQKVEVWHRSSATLPTAELVPDHQICIAWGWSQPSPPNLGYRAPGSGRTKRQAGGSPGRTTWRTKEAKASTHQLGSHHPNYKGI